MEDSVLIAEIKSVKRKPNYLQVVTASGESLELHADVIARFGIYGGVTLSSESMAEAISLDEDHRCREAAWRLLNHRPRSQAELLKGLQKRKFLTTTAQRIVDDLVAKGYLNDAAFARQFAAERSQRRDGLRLIAQGLRQRGLSKEETSAAIEEVRDPDREKAAARALLEKWNRRSKPEDPRKRSMAAAQHLLRKGYEGSVIWELVREVMGGTAGEECD